ncbi:uncharacterized protein PAC_08167 [Phialocephala subalpina]|uniref:2EXR domain-containing protein n=1 Tax=Phialocephala subalpina TaxID=576137 RepID=A0A1L7WZT7_9HELO|nr:uncharacterized protein PAC_08167 [Phialocephala subalpina]
MESQDPPSSQSPGPLRTFTCFPRLPIEIRATIWKHTLEPRVVELKFDCHECHSLESIITLYTKRGFYTEVRTPVAMEVNRDSRQAALPYYELCFSSRCYTTRTRFNFRLDTLYLDSAISGVLPLFFSIMTDNEVANLRYLALDVTGWEAPDEGIALGKEFKKILRKSISELEGLEELLISEKVDSWLNEDEWELGGTWKYSRVRFDHIQLLEEYPPMLSFANLVSWPWYPPEVFNGFKVNKQRFVLGLRKSMKAVPSRDIEKEDGDDDDEDDHDEDEEEDDEGDDEDGGEEEESSSEGEDYLDVPSEDCERTPTFPLFRAFN